MNYIDVGLLRSTDNDGLMCGLSSHHWQKAGIVVSATPGSKVNFQLVGDGGKNVCIILYGKVDLTLRLFSGNIKPYFS